MNEAKIVTALNVLYAKHRTTAYGIEPDTKSEAFVQGQISGISKALEVLSVLDGMPLDYAEDLTESDFEHIKKHVSFTTDKEEA